MTNYVCVTPGDYCCTDKRKLSKLNSTFRNIVDTACALGEINK